MSNESDDKEIIFKKPGLKDLLNGAQTKTPDVAIPVFDSQKIVAPSAPLNFNATQNFASDENKIILTWEPPTNTGGTPITQLTYIVALQEYIITTFPGLPGQPKQTARTPSFGPLLWQATTKLTYTFEKNLKAGEYYEFYVKAVGLDFSYNEKMGGVKGREKLLIGSNENDVKVYGDDGSFIVISNDLISESAKVSYMFIGRPSEPRIVKEIRVWSRVASGYIPEFTWEPPADDGCSAIDHYDVSWDNGETWTSIGLNKTYQFDLPIGSYDLAIRAVNKAGRLGIPAKRSRQIVPGPN
jgi:hypothetical protein